MDLVLHLADEYVLDKVWAHLVPLSAFAASSANSSLLSASASAFNTSAHPILISDPSSSTWTNLVSYLPHPPLSPETFVSSAITSLPATSAWPRDYLLRQVISLSAITLIGIHVLYILFAYLSYRYIFNHEMMKHPKFLKNQVKLEIQTSLRAFPGMTVLTLPWFVAEARGHSKSYESVDEYGWAYLVFSIIL
ncbi:hypothetical protein PHLCEN_2v4958 [Hermanssonia centrifuga]|uniref:Uncharacterized protein n=1 Tax=Hermanssonia centrifuga TaxID=98765 RepID=A0A2R6PD02_9APHY|nr:hypothetical protein PHLCEN_2v4958 [Hermanssonia centrifuga]